MYADSVEFKIAYQLNFEIPILILSLKFSKEIALIVYHGKRLFKPFINQKNICFSKILSFTYSVFIHPINLYNFLLKTVFTSLFSYLFTIHKLLFYRNFLVIMIPFQLLKTYFQALSGLDS